MRRNKKKLLCVLCGLCAAGAAVSGLQLYQELKPRAEAEAVYADVRAMAFPASSGSEDGSPVLSETGDPFFSRGKPDFAALQSWNPDICGWIYCPGTVIDYPVVQGSDNEWYLNHTADQKRSVVGSIFLESQNAADFSDDLSVIYGHHIRGGRMFTPISGYKDRGYYEKHPVMYLYTPETDYCVELFASEILNGSTGSFPLRFAKEEARKDWIDTLRANGAFLGVLEPLSEDRILALCTCTYEYQNARYVVYGILKEIEE